MVDAGRNGAPRDPAGGGTPLALCDYASKVTTERLERMLSHVDGVRKGDEAAPIHQMRVWSRRSRAALEIFRVCFESRAFAEIERAVKSATDALGEARDLDVMAENLEARAAKLPAAQRTGIEAIVERLRERRKSLQSGVAKAITELEAQDLLARFHALTQRAGNGSGAGSNGRTPTRRAPRTGKGRRKSG